MTVEILAAKTRHHDELARRPSLEQRGTGAGISGGGQECLCYGLRAGFGDRSQCRLGFRHWRDEVEAAGCVRWMWWAAARVSSGGVSTESSRMGKLGFHFARDWKGVAVEGLMGCAEDDGGGTGGVAGFDETET